MGEDIIFEIILHGGNARAHSYEALRLSEQGDFEGAEKLMKAAEEEIGQAHKIQADIIQREVQGEKYEINVLFVHAQDHLMTAVAESTLIESMIKQNKRIAELEGKLGVAK
jgi:PTS system cellobiose-specific IIA component